MQYEYKQTNKQTNSESNTETIRQNIINNSTNNLKTPNSNSETNFDYSILLFEYKSIKISLLNIPKL